MFWKRKNQIQEFSDKLQSLTNRVVSKDPGRAYWENVWPSAPIEDQLQEMKNDLHLICKHLQIRIETVESKRVVKPTKKARKKSKSL